MNRNSFQYADHAAHRSQYLRRAVWFALPALLLSVTANAQSGVHPKATQRTAPSELNTRITAAETARGAGDAAAVESANNRVIAAALRELAELKLKEAEYTQAAELYHRSLQYEAGPVDKAGDAPLTYVTPNARQRATLEAREKTLRTVLAQAFNNLATSQAVRGGFYLALDTYLQAEEWDNTLPGLGKNLGQCAFRTKNYTDAIRGLSLALQQGEDSATLRAMLGISYFATDQFAEAARSFAPLGPAGMKDGEAGYAWAASLTHLDDAKKATEVLTAFASEPRSNDTLLLIGQLWTEIGDYDRAIATFQRSLTSDPNLLKAHFDEGITYIHWERWPEAAREFQAELRLAPGDPDATYHLGFVYVRELEPDDALALFLEVIAAHPNYANAQYEAGKILLDRGQMEQATVHLEAAARLRPQADYMHYQLQAVYRKQGRSADADRELEIYKGLKAKSREHIVDAMKRHQ
jgi:tetratricopeptide (TPR) repeat protein